MLRGAPGLATTKFKRDCPRFQRCVRDLKKKFRSIEKDLDDHIRKIESDYETACNGFCVPMPGFPELQRRVWKYDIGSRDLRRPARECFRLIAILHPKDNPVCLLPIILYHKSDRANIIAKEILQLYKSAETPAALSGDRAETV